MPSSPERAHAPDNYILTVMGTPLCDSQLATLDGEVQARGWRRREQRRLSLPGRERSCVEWRVAGDAAAADALRDLVREFADAHALDAFLQPETLLRAYPRLAVFDMDSTLVEAEVIDELARAAGSGERVSLITERAMRGELDFADSFRERLATLRGLSVDCLPEIAAQLRLAPGAGVLIATLRAMGCRTAIVSGGFDYFARMIAARLGIDEVFANGLDIAGEALTGEVAGEIIDGARKAALLEHLAERHAVPGAQVIAVGDGANDLPMLRLAGRGVAYRAKPVVRASAPHAIVHGGLDSILFLLGLPERLWQLPPEPASDI